jgi:hypothetical protein
MTHTSVFDRIRDEYAGVPSLRMTVEQAQQLCGAPRRLCRMVLDALVTQKFLRVVSDEIYTRQDALSDKG